MIFYNNNITVISFNLICKLFVPQSISSLMFININANNQNSFSLPNYAFTLEIKLYHM